jgi:hypothetical protein
MTSQRYNEIYKSSDILTSNNAPMTDSSKSCSFVMQAQTVDRTQQPDLKTSLKQAEKYGHHATKIQPKMETEQSQVIQPKFRLPKFRWPFRKKKNTNAAASAPAPAPALPNWSDLTNEFQSGDKLYGLREARPQSAVKNAAAGKATVIDQLNNEFLGTNGVGRTSKIMGANAKNDPQNPENRKWMEEARYGKRKTAGTPTPEQQQEAAEYKTWLEDHSKYSPTNQRVREEPLSSPFRQWDRTKKSSKAGLEYTTKKKQKKVHFVLDGLNQEAVVKKLDHRNMAREQKINPETGDSQQSITASELRFLYRKRNDPDVIGNVQFWESGNRVAAPWLTNPALWNQYKPKSETTQQTAPANNQPTPQTAPANNQPTPQTAPTNNQPTPQTALPLNPAISHWLSITESLRTPS